MEQKNSSDEFDATMDEAGRILVPSEIRDRFAGKKVRVRLRSEEIAVTLRENNVTEEEIERIASVQLESREQVVKLLLSEGTLKGNTLFAARAAKGIAR